MTVLVPDQQRHCHITDGAMILLVGTTKLTTPHDQHSADQLTKVHLQIAAKRLCENKSSSIPDSQETVRPNHRYQAFLQPAERSTTVNKHVTAVFSSYLIKTIFKLLNFLYFKLLKLTSEWKGDKVTAQKP